MRKFSYKNLFKKLIDLDMTNNELIKKKQIRYGNYWVWVRDFEFDKLGAEHIVLGSNCIINLTALFYKFWCSKYWQWVQWHFKNYK